MTRLGKFIVVDGLDGAGKTTIVEYLNQLHIKDNINVCVTKGLGGGNIGLAIRKRMLSDDKCPPTLEALSSLTATMETYLDVVKPNLEQGNNVICDRYISSFIAYQIYGRGYKWLHDTLYKAILNIPNYHDPDVYIYCDVSVEESRRRIDTRNLDTNHFDLADITFKDMLRVGYETYYANNTNTINLRLDCNRPLELVLKSVEEIYNIVIKGAL